MDKINPTLYITDTDPIPEAVLNASGWFETEYLDIEATSSAAQYIEWYMAQGWTMLPTTVAESTSVPVFRWSSYTSDGMPTPPSFESIGYTPWTGSAYPTMSISQAPGPISVTGQYTSTTTSVTTYHLTRRKLQAERVLQDMITEFTDAYNEGREINDTRYDELVTLYDVMLDKSEDEIEALNSDTDAHNVAIDAIIAQINADLAAYDPEGDLDGYGDSMRLQINTRFDNELAKAESSLVTRGMYNTTIWGSTSAGIERERTLTLTDLEDKIMKLMLDTKSHVFTVTADTRAKVMAALERLIAAKRENKLAPLDFRNRIFGAMLNFMERRQDDYPGLDGLANLAAQLGYSEGAAVVAPTT